MEHAAEHAESGADRAVRIGPERGGDSHRESRGGELVIGEDHHRGVDRGKLARGRGTSREPIPETCGDPLLLPRRSARVQRRQALDQGREHSARRRDDRLGAEVVAERVGAGERCRHQADAIHRQRVGAQHALDAPSDRDRAGIGDPACLRRKVAGPQELRHLLEARARGEVDGVAAAIEVAPAFDGRDRRLDAHRPIGLCLAAAARGETVDLGGIEPARAIAGPARAHEQATADVGVEGVAAHPESGCGFPGREQGAWIVHHPARILDH